MVVVNSCQLLTVQKPKQTGGFTFTIIQKNHYCIQHRHLSDFDATGATGAACAAGATGVGGGILRAVIRPAESVVA
jgi:hypothetical protein